MYQDRHVLGGEFHQIDPAGMVSKRKGRVRMRVDHRRDCPTLRRRLRLPFPGMSLHPRPRCWRWVVIERAFPTIRSQTDMWPSAVSVMYVKRSLCSAPARIVSIPAIPPKFSSWMARLAFVSRWRVLRRKLGALPAVAVGVVGKP